MAILSCTIQAACILFHCRWAWILATHLRKQSVFSSFVTRKSWNEMFQVSSHQILNESINWTAMLLTQCSSVTLCFMSERRQTRNTQKKDSKSKSVALRFYLFFFLAPVTNTKIDTLIFSAGLLLSVCGSALLLLLFWALSFFLYIFALHAQTACGVCMWGLVSGDDVCVAVAWH